MDSTVLYRFGFDGGPVGDKSMKAELGGKAANLGEMHRMGLNVPPGITIPVSVCRQYRDLMPFEKTQFVAGYMHEHVVPALDELVDHLGHRPLFSVRSGAEFSMPGMMDTLLNVGMTTDNMNEWCDRIGYVAAMDCRRRQFEMYGTTVADKAKNIEAIKNTVAGSKYGTKAAPGIEGMYDSVVHVEKLVEKYTSKVGMPDAAFGQIFNSILAVFDSWDSPRCVAYRKMRGIDNDLGTAVTIQAMVFGNLNATSCSGVYFTRNPATGEAEPYGDLALGGQGEDVVAGTHDTNPLSDLGEFDPYLYDQLLEGGANLEAAFKDMVDTEFTIENGKLWWLQVRVGEREAKAAFRIAHDLAVEGMITKEAACKRVTTKQYKALTKTRIDLDEIPAPDYTGYEAGGSLVTGRPVYSSEDALKADDVVILVRDETTPDDIEGMGASVGILTRTGGKTSHAAVVARGLEKHCVVGVTDLPQDLGTDMITIDGATGCVWLAELPLVSGEEDYYSGVLLEWGAEGVVLRAGLEEAKIEGRCVTMGDARVNDVLTWLQTGPESWGTTGNIVEGSFFLDVRFPAGEMRDDDQSLWEITGSVVNPARSEFAARLAALIEGHPLGAIKKHAVVIAPSDAFEALTGAGWNVVAVVEKLDDLLDSSSGFVDLDYSKLNAETANKILALKEKAGEGAKVVPEPVSLGKLASVVFS